MRELESTITEMVKAEPDCEAFVGVLVMPEKPKSRFDANRSIGGIKFGRADRDKSNEALARIIERMQREFRFSKDSSAVALATQSKPKPCQVEVSASGTGEKGAEQNRNHTLEKQQRGRSQWQRNLEPPNNYPT